MPKIGSLFRKSAGGGAHEDASGKVYVGDKVRMKNKKEGTVTCIGPKDKREGIWLRLAFEETSATPPSAVPESKDSVKWVPYARVECILTSGRTVKMTVGDRVKSKKSSKLTGVIRYVGQLHFGAGGIWFGVELDQSKGQHNGTVKGKYYFECRKDKGMVYSAKQISLIKKKKSGASGTAADGDFGDDTHFTSVPSVSVVEDEEDEDDTDDFDDEDEGADVSSELVSASGGKRKSWRRHKRDDDGDLEEDSGSSKKKGGKRRSFAFFSGLKKKESTPESSSADESTSAPLRIMREKFPMTGFKMLCDDPLGAGERMRAEILEGKPKKRKITLKSYHKDLYEDKLGSIVEAPPELRHSMFRQKLRLCMAICQFSELTKVKLHMIEKKERILQELSDYIARNEWFEEEAFAECLLTISRNLFRPLPYHERPPQLFFLNDEVFDKDTNFEDPAWRHLKLVYDLVWRVINTQKVTPELMQRHMEETVLPRMVDLLASDDHRERAYLMMIIHKVYGRCLKLRPHLIDLMCRYLYRMIYTTEFEHYNGVVEILQIVCAIIPGLAVPVKDTWQSFLRNILVPLHKCRGLKKFWEPLTQCCVNYVAKDARGASIMIGGLLRYWPKQSPQKEEIFIMETVNIINVLLKHQDGFDYSDYSALLIAASHRLTACMLSTRQPVAERAIAAWRETAMQDLVDLDRKNILPKLAEAFHKNREHSNQQLKRSSQTVEQIYKNRDMVYWKDMETYLSKKEKKERDAATALEKAAVAGMCPPFPFSSKSRSKTMGPMAPKKVIGESLAEDGLRVDSFRMFELTASTEIDYAAVIAQIKQYDAEVLAKKKKRKHLTAADKSTRRRASWSHVRIMAAIKKSPPKRRRSAELPTRGLKDLLLLETGS